MSDLRTTEIIVSDLRNPELNFRGFQELVQSSISNLSFADQQIAGGVFRPWDFVLIDTTAAVLDHDQLYRSVLTSPSEPRVVLLLLDTEKRQPGEHVEVPTIFEDSASRIRVILLSDLQGCSWVLGESKPEGICYWELDPAGEANLSAICDTLEVPEVFDEVFSSTAESGAQAWSIGLKETWFGALPETALADALHDVGKRLVSEDARVAVLSRMESWRQTVTRELMGTESESGLIDADGAKHRHYAEVDQSRLKAESAFGLLGRRQRILERVSGFPSLQEDSARKLSQALERLETSNRDLIEEIEPGDGWQEVEVRKFRNIGLVLNRADTQRQERYLDSEHNLLEQVILEMDKALASGYSLASVRIELNELQDLIKPRSREELLSGRELVEVPPGLDKIPLGYEGVSLNPWMDKVNSAIAKHPMGPILLLGRWSAKIFKNPWRMGGIALLYLWVVLASLFDVFEVTKDAPSLLPTTGATKRVVEIVVLVLAGLMTVWLLTAAFAIFRTSSKIQKWGRKAGLGGDHKIVDQNREFLEQMAMNDWILFPFRHQASLYLDALLLSIEKLELLISELLLHASEDSEGTARARSVPNPSVKLLGGDLGQAAWYRQMEKVKKILREEIVEIVRHQYRIRTPEFRTIRWNSVAEKLVSDLQEPLEGYLTRLSQTGVLHVSPMMSPLEVERRAELAAEYWGNFKEISDQVNRVVLHDPAEEMVQFVNSEQITSLVLELESTAHVRFAPTPSRHVFTDWRDSLQKEVLFTKQTELAGVIRLVPFRPGVLRYQSDSLDNSSTA